MNLVQHYNQLYIESAQAILTGNYQIDSELHNQSDTRFGLSLLVRPNDQTKTNIEFFLDKVRAIDPTQYYYPQSDIHITLLSIISCYEGFKLESINTEPYVQIIQKCLQELETFQIELRGVTASPTALMIQGFPTDSTLEKLRDLLREHFKNSSLQQNIDSRYTLSTAHATVMRFQEKLQNPPQLLQLVEQFREYDFGLLKASKLELVYNDWYQRARTTRHIAEFSLR